MPLINAKDLAKVSNKTTPAFWSFPFLSLAPRRRETLVVYHSQKVSGKPGWKVNGTRLFGSF